MTIWNVHERQLLCPASRAGQLIDSLAAAEDQLWPGERWPRMKLDRPLQVGARGGHGPVRYQVSDFRPGCSVRFAFEAPRGFHGYHEFEVVPTGEDTCRLRHTLAMTVRGLARLAWPAVFRPLHDALIEDAMTKAQSQLGASNAERRVWSRYVRLLRAVLRRANRSRSVHSAPVTSVP